MTEGDIAAALAAGVGQSVPAAYIEFLDGLPTRPTLGDGYGPILDFGGRRWRPYDRARLAEVVRYGRGTPVPRAHETAAVAEELRAGDTRHNGEMSVVLAEQGFTPDRLARGFCVGDDGNGEPLFVDPESGGVFAYYHDGMDVEPWAESLAELLTRSQDWTGEEDDEPGTMPNAGHG